MIKRYTEYREMQQLRKDHLRKQKMRNLLVFSAIIFPLMTVLVVVDVVVNPDKPNKAQTSVKSEPQSINTPLEELSGKELVKLGTSEAEDFYGYKFTGRQAKYCLLVASEQSSDEITAGVRSRFSEQEINARIEVCTTETDSWTFNQLESELEALGERS